MYALTWAERPDCALGANWTRLYTQLPLFDFNFFYVLLFFVLVFFVLRKLKIVCETGYVQMSEQIMILFFLPQTTNRTDCCSRFFAFFFWSINREIPNNYKNELDLTRNWSNDNFCTTQLHFHVAHFLNSYPNFLYHTPIVCEKKLKFENWVKHGPTDRQHCHLEKYFTSISK